MLVGDILLSFIFIAVLFPGENVGEKYASGETVSATW